METPVIEILLVEDNPYDAEMIVNALGQKGLAKKVMVLEDGVQALDYLSSQGAYKDNITRPNPKLIILDLNMPKVGGIETLKKLKSTPETKHIPIVVHTSSKENNDIKTAYELGVNSYIVKPVEYDDFTETVGEIGLYWILYNESAV